MNLQRLRKLAGTPTSEADANPMLNETTEIPIDANLDVIGAMLDAARRGLGFANKLSSPEQRKKHVRAVFINLNKIRAALAKLLDA